MDKLTKSAHFLPIREDFKMERLARIYINEIVVRHGVPCPSFQIVMADSHHTFGELFRRACVMDFGGGWDTHLSLVEFSYNNNYHKSIKCAPFEALYGHKCRSPVICTKIGKSQLIGPDTKEKIMQIKGRLKITRDRVLLKVSLWKGVVRFDTDLQVLLEEIEIDDKLYFVKELVEIMDRQVKKLKRSWIPLVKVCWNSRRGSEFTWECEDQFKAKYPHLFASTSSAVVI
nr:hypothetical protein [Tanacetum cinerariifolium]